MTSFDVVAQRSRRDSRHLYVFAVPLSRITDVIPVPTVGQRAEGNRMLDVRHAREFGAYWTRSLRWAVPPLLLDTPEKLDRWFEITLTAGGLSAGVLRLPSAEISGLRILDGQHRVYGWAEVRTALIARAAVLHERLDRAVRSGDERSIIEVQRGLAEIAKSEQRLTAEQVTVEVLDGVNATEHKQWFFDIAANAKGITKSLTASFDQTSAMNRAAVRLADDYPYLDQMVEREAERVGVRSAELVSMAQLVSIVETAVLGIDGAVRADALAALDPDSAYEIGAGTLDALFDGFDALRAVADGDDGANPVRLRENSLLGSVTVLRVLAGVVNRAAVTVRDGKFVFDEGAADRVTDFFKRIADDMDGDLPDVLWASGAFETRLSRAPRARRQEAKALFSALWAMWIGYIDGARNSSDCVSRADVRHAVQDALDFGVGKVPEPAARGGGRLSAERSADYLGTVAAGTPATSDGAPTTAVDPSRQPDDDDAEAEPDSDIELDEPDEFGDDTDASSDVDQGDESEDVEAGRADGAEVLADTDDDGGAADGAALTDIPAVMLGTAEEEFFFEGSDESDSPQQQVRTRGATTDPVKDYLKQIGRVALLSADQEVDLAKRIESGLFAEERLAQSYGPGWDKIKSSADQRRLHLDLREVAHDGRRAKAQLLGANLRLVVSLAKRFSGRGMPILDLIQEGNIGLIRAVEKFDYSMGFKFSTYATWWIRQAITRAIADQARTIRLPVHVVEKINVIRKAQHELVAKHGEATFDAIAHATDIAAADVERYLAAARPVFSLDVLVAADPEDPRGEWDGTRRVVPLGETLATEADDIDELVDRTLLSEQIDRALDMLAAREREIIARRFGLHDGEPWTLDAIGRVYGVSRERIRQLEKLSLEQLHSTMLALAEPHYVVNIPPLTTKRKSAKKPATSNSCESRATSSTSGRRPGTDLLHPTPKKTELSGVTAAERAKKATMSGPAATVYRAASTSEPAPGRWRPPQDRRGAPWSTAEDDEVRKKQSSGLSVAAIAQMHGRSETAIRYRFATLGLIEDCGCGSGSGRPSTLEGPQAEGSPQRRAGERPRSLPRDNRTASAENGQTSRSAESRSAAAEPPGKSLLAEPALADLLALAGRSRLLDADALRMAFEASDLSVPNRQHAMQELWSRGYRIGKFNGEFAGQEASTDTDLRVTSTHQQGVDVAGDLSASSPATSEPGERSVGVVDSTVSIALNAPPSSPTREVSQRTGALVTDVVRGSSPPGTASSNPPAPPPSPSTTPPNDAVLLEDASMPSATGVIRTGTHGGAPAANSTASSAEMLPSIPQTEPVPVRGRHVAQPARQKTADARHRPLSRWLRRAVGLN